MKPLYILWNYDCDQPVIASEDKDLLNEYMCDFFMEDDFHYYLTYFDILGNDLVIV